MASKRQHELVEKLEHTGAVYLELCDRADESGCLGEELPEMDRVTRRVLLNTGLIYKNCGLYWLGIL